MNLFVDNNNKELFTAIGTTPKEGELVLHIPLQGNKIEGIVKSVRHMVEESPPGIATTEIVAIVTLVPCD